MADELELLTENEAGDSWVDIVPGSQITTSYQAQNTNLEARTNGLELSSIRADDGDIIVEVSGPIDVNGLPFIPTQEITLTPSAAGTYYIKIIDGSTYAKKSVQLTTTAPEWDGSKNGFYSTSGERYFNYVVFNNTIISFAQLSNKDAAIGSTSEFQGFPFAFARWADIYDSWSNLKKKYSTSGGVGFSLNTLNGNSYSSNGGTNIYYQEGVSNTILSTFTSPVSSTQGLFHRRDVDELYICSKSSTIIYRVNPLTGATIGSFAVTGSSGELQDISYDPISNIIYIADFLYRKIWKVDGSSFSILGNVDTPKFPIGVEYDFVKNSLITIDLDTDPSPFTVRLLGLNKSDGAEEIIYRDDLLDDTVGVFMSQENGSVFLRSSATTTTLDEWGA